MARKYISWIPTSSYAEIEEMVDPLESGYKTPPGMDNTDDDVYPEDPKEKQLRIRVERPAFSQQSFNAAFEAVTPQKKNVVEKIGSRLKCTCSLHQCSTFLVSLFPIIGWVTTYNLKEDFIPDVITGVTIGIFQVPQGMAYSMLAGVDPVYGLYTSFFPVLIYVIMGTSRHVSVGTFAIVTLMTGTIVRKFSTPDVIGPSQNTSFIDQTSNITSYPADTTENAEILSPIEVATTVCFIVGMYQILFGVCRLGFLCTYLSRHLVSGFTTASACYVFTSQLSTIFGVKLPSRSGALNLIYTYIDFFQNIHRTNYITLLISIFTIAFLYILKRVQDRYKRHLKFPIPGELIVVIAGTLVSNYLFLYQDYGVSIVGEVPTGLPQPSLPNFKIMPSLLPQAVSVTIVSFSITLSICKIYEQKHNYKVDANQELLAIGSANVFGCFFRCIPISGSLSRSAVQDGSGGKTQIVSLINCAIILLVMLFIGQLLEPLPKCILGSIIVIALRSLLLQVTELKRYWKVSKIDGAIWLVTFLSTVILDVDIGLAVGVLFSLLTLILRSQRPKTFLLGSVGNTDVYVPVDKYLAANEILNIKIFHFAGPLHFASAEYFISEIARQTGVNYREVLLAQKKEKAKAKKLEKSGIENPAFTDNKADLSKLDNQAPIVNVELNGNTPSLGQDNQQNKLPTHVIIDCSGFSFIDTPGAFTLKQVVEEYQKIGVKIFLAACSGHVYRVLEKDGFFMTVSAKQAFPTINDAVLHALRENQSQALSYEQPTLSFSTHI